MTLADAWMSDLLALPDRLMILDETIGKAEDSRSLLHPLWLARTGKPVEKLLQSWRKRSQESVAKPDWNITQASEFQSWPIQGQSLTKSSRSRSGGFAVSANDDQLITGIYPSGRYSHLISTKDRGVLLSPRVLLKDERDLWMLVAGDGGAVMRYAIQNYPRNGTVYPTRNVSNGQWRWERFPLDYWKGDHVHVEFTTAADQPVLAKTGAERSWIGGRRVAMFPKGREPFRDEFAFGRPLLRSWQKAPPMCRDVSLYPRTIAKHASLPGEWESGDRQQPRLCRVQHKRGNAASSLMPHAQAGGAHSVRLPLYFVFTRGIIKGFPRRRATGRLGDNA